MSAGSVVEQLTGNTGRLMELPIKDVKPSKDNPRRDLGDLDGLVTSIGAQGIIEPLIVTTNGNGYVLVAGHRRWAAAKQAKLKTVPAIVREYDDTQARAVRLVENLQREDLDPLDEAAGFAQLVELGHSQRTIADMVGCSQPHVSKRLALLELPTKVRKGLATDKVTIEDALELGRLAKKDEAAAVAIFDASQQNYYYGDVTRDVKAKLHAIKQAEDRAKAVAEFEKSSVPLIDLPDIAPWQLADNLPKGAVPLEGRGALDIDPKTHNGEPCHAVAIDREGGQFPVCTDPSRHAGVGSKKARAQAQAAAEAERRKEQQKAERAAKRSRLDAAGAAVRSYGDSTMKKDEVEAALQVAASVSIAACWDQFKKMACQLLDLNPPKTETDWSTTYHYDQPLLELATTGPAGAAAVVEALLVARRENEIQDEYTAARNLEETRAYFAWLEEHGHEVSDVETAFLEGAEKAAAEWAAIDDA